MVFHPNNHKNIFRPLFCYFLPNFAILRPPIFSGHEQFFGASFELFSRKFGHLAPVSGTIVSGIILAESATEHDAVPVQRLPILTMTYFQIMAQNKTFSLLHQFTVYKLFSKRSRTICFI
jgi:hypothetical protein